MCFSFLYIIEGKYITVYTTNFLAFIFFNLFLIDIYAPLCYYILVPRGTERKKHMCCRPRDGRKEGFTMKKFCTKCGKQFEAIGREVICPACKQAAAEDAKRAAVLKAKKASWTGESVPVRISGRASTVIRAYGAEKCLPFAAALDSLLQATACFQSSGKAWEDITPYKSHRRDKHATEDAPQTTDKQDTPQASKPQDGAQAAQAAKTTSKTSKATSKTNKGGKA